MKKDTIIIFIITFLALGIYSLTLRGMVGNPKLGEDIRRLDVPLGPFESSHEVGPYGHIVNLAERGSYDLTQEWANITTPDVGVSNGKYYSYFAPGVPYLALPFYLVGERFGYAQVGTFYAEILMGILAIVFLYKIARDVFKLSFSTSFFSVLVFAFASTSWSYFITLYQHAFTSAFIITGFYAAWRFKEGGGRFNWLYAAYVWAAYALAIAVDYPNAVLMLPVMVYFAVNTFSLKRVKEGLAISIRWAAIFTTITFLIITGFHFWHNAHYFGSWNKLSSTLEKYQPESLIKPPVNGANPTIIPPKEKTAIGFFKEKNIPRGFFVLLFSDERGLFFFTPIFILSIFGVIYVIRKKVEASRIYPEYILASSLIAVNIFLYSSWGDPWGGFAFGPRYLISSIPFLALFVGVFVEMEGKNQLLRKVLAYILFIYSSGIALLGALTTNAVPTKAEAMFLPIKKYNFLKNIDFVYGDQSGSFVYNTYLAGKLSLVVYYLIIYISLALIAAFVLVMFRNKNHG